MNTLLGDNARFDELMNRLKGTGMGKSVSASEWSEVVDFIEENIMTEEKIMKEYECGKVAGIREASESIRSWLMNKAADKFKNGDDSEATMWRNAAKTIAVK